MLLFFNISKILGSVIYWVSIKIDSLASFNSFSIHALQLILQISKFGIVLKNETYDPDRMTKLLIILWTHKSGLNKDITNTPRADVKEIK